MDFRFDIIYEYRWMFFLRRIDDAGADGGCNGRRLDFGFAAGMARLINPEKAGVPMRALAWMCVRFLLVCYAVPRYAIVCTNCDLGLCLVPIFRSSSRRCID